MKKLLCAALVLAACSDPVASGVVRVDTEREAYAVFRPDQVVTVRFTVANAGDKPISVSTCASRMNVQVQRKQDGDWIMVTPVALPCPGVAALRVIEPGGASTDSVTVQGFGTWRVHVPYNRGQSGGNADSREFETWIPPD
ncbi:MAG TPA: hypothetical protein VF771_14680 [Longimicrobiaceae bacterium]